MQYKVCYSYDSSGFYTGTTEAWPDPQQPGNWLLPAFATFDAPPSAPGKVARWNGKRWELVDEPQQNGDEGGIPQEVLVQRERQARIADASAALASVQKMIDLHQKNGQTVLKPWLDYIDSLIAISNTPQGSEPPVVPPPPDSPVIETPAHNEG